MSEEILAMFDVQLWRASDLDALMSLRDQFRSLCVTILGECPKCEERSEAIKRLREAYTWVVASKTDGAMP